MKNGNAIFITFVFIGILLLVSCKEEASDAVSKAKPEPPPSAVPASEPNSIWLTDFQQAKKEAKEKNLPILVDFSGSDWCGWCIKLDKEVFSRPEFIDFAKKNFVLLLLDFPKADKQDKKTKIQNAELAQKYKVSGFPTVLILDAEGNVLKQTGYVQGGAESYINHLKEIKESISK